jgi:5-amino-6-(5-phosphoribosylamino)uracil reductase
MARSGARAARPRRVPAAGRRSCWDDAVHPLLLPPPGGHGPDDTALDDTALAAHYAYPDGLAAPYVRVNFVSSADGAVSVDGRSGGLGSVADRRVFGMLRELADVVLVGAGTVRTEDYRGARRPTRGRDTPPPIAVVTGSAGLDPESRLFTDTAVPPIVLTLASAPADNRERLAAAGADVVVLERLTPDALLAELARRGLHRVLCEGGPMLFGDLVAADAVDELCLTVAPLLAGGTAGRIAAGPEGGHARPLQLVGALHADGALLLRYRRATPIE